MVKQNLVNILNKNLPEEKKSNDLTQTVKNLDLGNNKNSNNNISIINGIGTYDTDSRQVQISFPITYNEMINNSTPVILSTTIEGTLKGGLGSFKEIVTILILTSLKLINANQIWIMGIRTNAEGSIEQCMFLANEGHFDDQLTTSFTL